MAARKLTDEQIADIKNRVDGGEQPSLRDYLALLDHIDVLAALARPPVAQDSEVRQAAEKLLAVHKRYEDSDTDDDGNVSYFEACEIDDQEDWPCAVATIARAALVAGERAARYRAALEKIRSEYGKVCDSYELSCHHTACDSSVGSWMEADEALAASGTAPASPTASRTDIKHVNCNAAKPCACGCEVCTPSAESPR